MEVFFRRKATMSLQFRKPMSYSFYNKENATESELSDEATSIRTRLK